MKSIEFHALAYSATPHAWVSDLYGLRKEVFADRLNWKVKAVAGAECNTVIELKLEHHAA